MIAAELTGDTSTVALFDDDKIPQQYYDGILGKVTELTDEMYAIARGLAPSKSGQLRASIHQAVGKGKDFIKGRVYSDAGAKAVALEYGATGRSRTNVRAHEQKLDHLWAKVIAPITVQVSAHTRIQNIAPHPFMKPALAQVGPKFVAGVQQAIDQVTAKANAELGS